MNGERVSKTERPGLSLAASIALHAGLASFAFLGLWKYLPLGGAHPGSAAPGAIQANLVEKVPGGAVPIPSPVVLPTKNRLANDVPGPSVSVPAPRRVAPKDSVALPSYQPEKLAREQARAELRKLAQADKRDKNDQRVPYGAGGRVSFSATTSSQGAGGSGGVSFGDANFGNLYTAWVNHLRDRLQYYWNQQPREPNLPTGARVTVTLTVHRSGQINAVHYLSRTNSVEVNSMAFNAVQQMAAAERFPLPANYVPNALVVTVAFELN